MTDVLYYLTILAPLAVLVVCLAEPHADKERKRAKS